MRRDGFVCLLMSDLAMQAIFGKIFKEVEDLITDDVKVW